MVGFALRATRTVGTAGRCIGSNKTVSVVERRMLDALLHAGVQHPDLGWILIPSLLAFAAGLVLAALSGRSVPKRVRDWRSANRSTSDE